MDTQQIDHDSPDARSARIEVAERDLFQPSFAQESLWFLHQLEPESTAYHVYNPQLVKGPLNLAALQQSMNALIERYEVLRTHFEVHDGRPMQAIAPRLTLDLRLIDISGFDDDTRQGLISPLVFASIEAPFDLAHGPLLHADIIRLTPTEHILMITFHHIIADRWSTGIFWRELNMLYNAAVTGELVRLPPLSIQYADYAEWQRETLQGETLAQQLAFWQEQLDGVPNTLDLPTDHIRQPGMPYAGGLDYLRLSESLTSQVRALAQRENVTLFMILLAAFQVLLARYTGQDDIVVGIPIAGRNRVELEPQIGLFINTLALRTNFTNDPSFVEVLQRVRETCLGAFDHQDLPFEKLVEALNPDRHLGTHPLFQTLFVLQNTPGNTALGWHDLVFEDIDVQDRENKFPLSLGFWDEPGALKGDIEYDAALFTPATIARLADHFQRLLGGLVAAPTLPISQIPMMGPAEVQQLLDFWRAPVTAPAAALNVPALFAQRAAQTPDAVALVWRDQQITFAELDRRANQLARHLRRRGVGAETCVGVCLERAPEVAVTLLGVMRAGATYLPLDVKTPPERARYMVTNSRVPLLLTQARLAPTFADLHVPILAVDAEWPTIAAEDDTPFDGGALPESAAYVIYTSGSTGIPKGVVVPHRALMDRMLSIGARYGLQPSDRLLQFVSLSFDVSLEEIFPTWNSGATVVLLPEEGVPSLADVTRMTRAQGLTVLDLPPSYWHEWVADLVHARAAIPPSVRLVVLGSEASSPAVVAEWERLTEGRVAWCNVYGLTETTLIAMTYGPGTTQGWEQHRTIPIGRGLDNTRLYVLDSQLQPAPIGVPGELYIGGPGLARGYMGRPDLTAERFVPDPFVPDEPGARMYRTGDLVRTLADGLLEFLGRIDTQVKMRGFRIELSEIETVLRQYPGVREAVVLAVDDGDGSQEATRLVGFVVTTREAAAMHHRLQRYLEAHLPPYMVPATIVPLQLLPRTPGGKIDRRALLALLTTSQPREGVDLELRTPTEHTLAQIWTAVLRVEPIGRQDDFFKLGGHSLQATQVVARIRDAFAVELPVRLMYDTPTLAALAEQIALLQRDAVRPPSIMPVARDGNLPLSFAQQRLWFLDQLDPESALYTIPGALLLRGDLHVDALVASLNALVARHEPLRTTFTVVDGTPVQHIAPSLTIPLPVVDLQGLPDADLQETVVRDLLAEEGRQGFDLARGPLIRAWLFRLSTEEQVLVLTLHHSVADGWSSGILFRELQQFYTAYLFGRNANLPPLAVQYADYALWQRTWLQGDVLASHLDYWQRQLAGAPAVLELPTDFPRPPELSYRGSHLTFTLPSELSQQLRALSQAQGVTLFMLLLAAFQVLLLRYTEQEDIVVGSPVAGRQQRETEDLIGLFVNTLALRTDLSGDPSFTTLLQRVRDVCVGAYEHQDIPFEKLVDALQLERNLRYTPLFQVLFALQHATEEGINLPGVALFPIEWGSETAKFDLSLNLTETGDALLGWVEYNTDIFLPATVARICQHWHTLLESIVAEPHQTITRLNILPAEERRQVVEEWNTTTRAYPREATLAQVFIAQAQATPDAIALVGEDQHLSYATLLARASQLAHHLRTLGVGPEVPVGLALERSVDLVPALLGIVLAGGAYVPLDPSYPPARLTQMLADSGAVLVLTQPHLHGPFQAAPVPVLDVNHLWPLVTGYPPTPPTVAGTAADLAYLCYTSGSTGLPKGVAIPQRAVLRLVCNGDCTSFGPATTFLQFAPLAFDAATLELWGPLLTGGRLVIAPAGPVGLDALGQVLRQQAITTLWLTAGLFHVVVEEALPLLAGLRHLLAGGDVLHPAAVQRVRTTYPQLVVSNGYGPTENTTFATCYAMQGAGEMGNSVPIGRPIANTTCYVLDAQQQPVPIGVAGELYLGGDGLARGYWRQAGLTGERFVPHPFVAGERLYRTGDRVRWQAGGTLVFEGRRDGQVKVRGYRIEVGEVERALGQVAGVQASVVVVRTTEGGEKQVVGYVVGAGITASQVRGALQAMVPAYLVPAVIVVVPRLPLTPNGKVDRAALQAMEQAVAVTPESEEAPQGEREEQLAAVWAEVLQRPTVGRHANFFEIGGDSILSMQIIARARRIGILLAPRQLFQYQTIAELATVATLAETTTAEQEPISGPVPLTPIQHWFFEQDLADMHQYNQAMMLACPQAVDAAALAKALQHLVRHHDALRLRFTHDAAGWHQRNAGPEEVASSILTTTDLSGYPDAEQAAQMHLLATNAQASLDLHNGPLLRAVLFHLGASKRARLLIAVHHLAVDAVSWRVLVEDLATAYRQAQAAQPAQLPPKTTSFRRWAEQLAAFAQTPAAIRDLAHWRNPARQQIAPLPVDRSYDPAANTEDSARTVVETLTQEETHDLLQKVPKAYHTHINEVLLAALGATMREWTGSPLTLVDLEGHGRETFLDDIDLSRTVGWFTSIFPVLLDVTEATQPGPLLMTIKEQLRAIPDRGVGYGILRYLRHGDGVAEELRQLPAAEISFNYLGQLDGGPPSEGDFEPTDESTGTAFSPRARRRYLLDILSNVSGGQLRCTWVYSEQVHDQATIANLAQRFGDHLRAIISHCLALESSVHTPSDFPLAHMNAQKLNKLAALLDEEDEKD